MFKPIKAPFPYFGGKSKVAAQVWARFGNVANYVEPFFGSGAVLLGRPHPANIETVNDIDCYLANFWRAVQADPEAVAHHADWPVNEADLHARHRWLVMRLDVEAWRERMKTEPDFFCVKTAGWWVWGAGMWIGRGWCDDTLHQKRPHLAHAGKGVNAVSLWQQIPVLDGGGNRGIHRNVELPAWLQSLSNRLRRVRVCCGDWSRITGPSVLRASGNGVCGVFLDPPYSAEADRAAVYAQESLTVAHDVRRWALEHGDDPALRIALCGYEGEHCGEMPLGWSKLPWKTSGGYGNQGTGRGRENSKREVIWFSPHCLAGDFFGTKWDDGNTPEICGLCAQPIHADHDSVCSGGAGATITKPSLEE